MFIRISTRVLDVQQKTRGNNKKWFVTIKGKISLCKGPVNRKLFDRISGEKFKPYWSNGSFVSSFKGHTQVQQESKFKEEGEAFQTTTDNHQYLVIS